tara:strand:+ start:1911 stop:2720 length:810 start_codon:yes stop_codon:yes gene_type:complete
MRNLGACMMNFLLIKNSKATLSLCGILLVFLTSCAAPITREGSEALLPEIDVLQMKENTDAALKISRQTKMDVDAMQTRLIEMERRQMDLENTIQTLPVARMEELESKIILLSEEIRLLQSEFEGKLSLKTFQPSGNKRTTRSLSQQPAMYQKALGLFNHKDFMGSIAKFQRFIAEIPSSEYADDAVFWIGESHFNLGDYARAIEAFQKVFSYIRTDKGDDAQFRIGLCYLRLGDSFQAVAEFKKLSVIYPDSEYIVRANTELRKLGIQ